MRRYRVYASLAGMMNPIPVADFRFRWLARLFARMGHALTRFEFAVLEVRRDDTDSSTQPQRK